MRRNSEVIRELCRTNRGLFCIVLLLDCVYFLSIWLIDDRKARVLAVMIVLFTMILFGLSFLWQFRQYRKKEAYLYELLETGEIWEKQIDTQLFSAHEQYLLKKLGNELQKSREERNALELSRKEQTEYVETWVHELKTPIALFTLLLDNRAEEMSRQVYHKISYINGKLQEYAEQILYYSRLNCEHKDYIFQSIELESCIEDIIRDYGYFLEEKQIQTELSLKEKEIFTDKKGLEFMLRQIVSNAVTYLPKEQEEKRILFSAERREGRIFLSVEDNGRGVRVSDLPFVFEKGFSGDNQEINKKTTGMGLYLVKEMSKCLHLTCEARSDYGRNFCVVLGFPVVEEE